MHDAYRGGAGSGELHLVLPQALQLHPEARTIPHEKSEIADLRNVDARVVDLVDDSAADREPQARGAERATDDLLTMATTMSGALRR
jgi:hypothetical protein